MTLQGQYGGALAPAVSPKNGGASVLSNLGSAALGMFTGGAGALVGVAAEAVKDTPTTQNPTSTNTQSTGSKVFNLAPAQDALANNPFWLAEKSGGALLPVLLILGGLGVMVWLILRRK